MQAFIDGEELGEVTAAETLVLDLPESLATGLPILELRMVDGPGGLDVLSGVVEPSHPPGRVRLHDGELLQSGFSLVEIPISVDGRRAARILGSFRAPKDGDSSQRFTMELADASGESLGRFVWEAGDSRDGSRPIALDVPPAAELIRVRLFSAGRGAAGSWRDLRLSFAPRERSQARSAEAADSSSPPLPRLVVVYVMDALRADYVGYVNPAHAELSQTWDRLAQEGAAFLAHRAMAPNTHPSTLTLMTGSPVSRDGEDAAYLAEIFRRAGYRTGLFSGNVFVSRAYGLDRGFDVAPSTTLFEEGPAGYNDNAELVHRAALDWLRTVPERESAFLYLHTMSPHNPYDPPQDVLEDLGISRQGEIDGSTETLVAIQEGDLSPSPEAIDRLRQLYGASLYYNDRELSRFVSGLLSLADREEILLVLTSDHGEELFDHGGVLHGFTLYDELLRIPLVIWGPEWVRSQQIAAPTNTLDLRATLFDLLGVEDGAAGRPWSGRSLLPLLTLERPLSPDAAPQFAVAPHVRGGIFAVLDRSWKLIAAASLEKRWGLGRGPGRTHDALYLFDLGEDPEERRNLMGSSSVRELQLGTMLESWSDFAAGEGVAPARRVGDEETVRRLQALGYLDR